MRILATNHDQASAMAMVPVLKRLQESGNEILTLARDKDCPAYDKFKNGGFAPRIFGRFTSKIEDKSNRAKAEVVMMEKLLRQISPDFVLVGVSTFDYGTEKQALLSAVDLGIPVAFLIVESWPHLWLDNYRERDVPLYQKADLIMVMDETSKKKMIEVGFDEKKITITGNPNNEELAKLQVDVGRRQEIRHAVRGKLRFSETDLVFSYAITNNLERGQVDIGPNDPRWLGCKESDVLGEFLETIKEIQTFRACQALIRIKPGREREPIQEIVNRIYPGALIIGSEIRDGKEVILATDVVIGTVSIFLQEANYLRIQEISYLPNLPPGRENPHEANRIGAVHTIRGLLEERRLRHCLIDLACHQESQMTLLAKKIRWLRLEEGATERVAEKLTKKFSYQYG